MNYVLPNDLALKHNVSLKTIYNHLSKFHGKIGLKKELWKTYVFEPDFEKYYSKEIQNLQSDLQRPVEIEQTKGLWTLKEDFETLQKNYNIVSQQKEDVSKYNLALQEQVTKYSLLLKDEKDEKKEILNKYDWLQKQYNETIHKHGKEMIRSAKAFYLLLWIAILLFIIIGFWVFYLKGGITWFTPKP